MNLDAARRYCLTALPLAVLAAFPLFWASRPGWAALGFTIMAVCGIGGGAWLAHRLGHEGPGFLLALASSMLARLFAGALGAAAAAWHGEQAVWSYVAGLVVGFLPLQLHEIAWFFGRARREDCERTRT